MPNGPPFSAPPEPVRFYDMQTKKHWLRDSPSVFHFANSFSSGE